MPYLHIEGITQDRIGDLPPKYSRHLSGYETTEQVQALTEEVIAEYKRDKAREEAQYIQDLELIQRSKMNENGQSNTVGKELEMIHSKPQHRISGVLIPGDLNVFWEKITEGENRIDTFSFIQTMLERSNFDFRVNISQIDDLILFNATPFDKVKLWFLKKCIFQIHRPAPHSCFDNENSPIPEVFDREILLEQLCKQLESESVELAENIRSTLLSEFSGSKQVEFLLNVINLMRSSRRSNESFEKIYTYTVLLLAELTRVEAFSIANLPPTMEILLKPSKSDLNNKVTTGQVFSKSKPAITLGKDKKAAFVAITDAAKKVGIVEDLTDERLAKTIGAKNKNDISSSRNDKVKAGGLARPLYDFILALLRIAKPEELKNIKKDIEEIYASKFR